MNNSIQENPFPLLGYKFLLDNDLENFWTIKVADKKLQKVISISSSFFNRSNPSKGTKRSLKMRGTEFKVSDFVQINTNPQPDENPLAIGKITKILFNPKNKNLPLSIKVDWYEMGNLLYSNKDPIDVRAINQKLDLDW